MTIQEMKERKKELGLSNSDIARLSGIPFSTVHKIFCGVTSSPRSRTLFALERVLSPSLAEHKHSVQYSDQTERVQSLKIIRESPEAYGVSHPDEKEKSSTDVLRSSHPISDSEKVRYTLDDYYSFPDDRKIELIDGAIYDMAAPSVLHQKILAALYLEFESCITAHKAECEVFLSPCDVQLDQNDQTMVQPDLFILCRKYDIHSKAICGAPDLIVEILSDSTRSKDLILKNYKYYTAGVKEYWIVDPEFRRIIVYFYEHSKTFPEQYSFTSEIPVGISGDNCFIHFENVYKKVARYYAD